MEQIEFFPFDNPSNIYGLATIKAGKTRVLVKTLEKQIFSIEYSYEEKRIVCNQIHFAYIPSKYSNYMTLDIKLTSNY